MRAERRRTLLGICIALLFLLPQVAAPASPVESDPSSPAKTCSRSVVQLRVLDASEHLVSTARGFLLRPGVVATEHHTLAGGTAVRIRSAEGIDYPVEGVLATDETLDVALLAAHRMYEPALEIGDVSTAQIGDAVFSVDSTGPDPSTCTGSLTKVPRAGLAGRVLKASLPVSAKLPGAPLLDRDGRILGLLHVSSFGGSDFAFATPVDTLLAMLVKASNPPVPLTAAAPLADKGSVFGILPTRTVTLWLRVPNDGTASVALPRHHHYDLSTVSVTVDGLSPRRGDRPRPRRQRQLLRH